MSAGRVSDAIIPTEPEVSIEIVDDEGSAQPSGTAVAGWDEAQWAKKIMAENAMQVTSRDLQAAVKQFETKANITELQQLAETHQQFKGFLAAAQKLHDSKQLGRGTATPTFAQKFRKARSNVSATLYIYSQHLDVLVNSAPEYVSLAWGAIKILLIADVNHSKLRSCVADHLMEMSRKFRLVETLTVYIPSSNMVTALSEAYANFSRFLEKCVKYYSENKFMTAVNAFARPWEARFQPSVDRVTHSITHIMDISQTFTAGALTKILTIVERLDALVQGQYIHLGSAQDNEQFQVMLEHKMHERLCSPATDNDAQNEPAPKGNNKP